MQNVLHPEPSNIGAELRSLLRLAIPVVFAELGWFSMTIVDTIMVGPLGAAAIGATGVGSSAFYTLAIFGMGLLLGLDTLISQAFGAGDRRDCHKSLAQGVYLSLAMTVPLMIAFRYFPPLFRLAGVNPEVSALATPFLLTLNWSTLPLLLYASFRRYLQGIGHVRPVMVVLVSANLVNWFGNWLLIQGHWGLPALGITGSALSTCVGRVYMCVSLAGCIWYFERKTKFGVQSLFRKPDFERLKHLWRLGFPAAMQIVLEVGAFSAAAFLAARLTPAALAAHQIAISCAALTYMVPLGTASAAAVAVGQSIGRRELRRARGEGYMAVALGSGFMCLSGLTFWLAPEPILRVYTSDAEVIRIGAALLSVAAIFQFFDGIQTVTTGALRGLGNTRTPMIINLAGYYVFGLPLGYLLCFNRGYGIYGLWIGLSVALISIAIYLLITWQRDSKRLVGKESGRLAPASS